MCVESIACEMRETFDTIEHSPGQRPLFTFVVPLCSSNLVKS